MNDTEAQEFIARLDATTEKRQTTCGPEEKMTWRRWGEGKPVVLLHGGAGSWMHWIRNISVLARDRAVWVPDMPGFGDSDAPADAKDSDSIAPMVLRGIRELLHEQRFDLVGFSFGTLVAAEIAASAPATLDKLILVSASGLGLFQGAVPLLPLKGIDDPAERQRIKRKNLQAMMIHDDARIDPLALRVHEAGARRERVKNRTMARTDVILKLASRWQVPVYGIWGREDSAYRGQFDKLMAVADSLKLRDKAYIDDAGHWVPYEKSEELNATLLRMLEAS